MKFFQKNLQLSRKSRGFHLITREVGEAIPDIAEINVGLLQVFVQHTSASLTLNENADPDVRIDMEMAINKIAPESFPYVHTCEGPDDMPAHVKASLMGASLTIPITNGKLALGAWQGIYLCEHRNNATPRRLVLTAFGS